MAQPASKPTIDAEKVVSLIREGWDHLRSQSPLAAWGSWREAIRLDPDSKAAQQALATLESAGELPEAARARYRFMSPGTTARRERWDARLRGASPGAAGAAAVFSDLTEEDPEDAEAWYNRGLCLGWTGQNREAIASLDRYVALRAESDFELTVSAWLLAEILRQGRGAEALADEMRFAISMSWSNEESNRLASYIPGLRRIPTPPVPTTDTLATPQVNIFEWLEDSNSITAAPGAGGSPRGILLLATVYESPGSLRLSSPRADTLETALERLAQIVDLEDRGPRREAAPLPLPFLDADVWTLRLPEGLDPGIADRLTREHIEFYYENRWIQGKRHGLDGRSPLEASALAANGDRIARAKLTAVVRLREQLASRQSVGSLYQGYPFDRLRTRLGLEPADGKAFETEDLASASAAQLGLLDPAALPDARLASAFESANGLRDDRLAARFASELVNRSETARQAVDLAELTACLVRLEMSKNQPDRALAAIGRMESEAAEAERRRLMTWRAEILARGGRCSEAAAVYHDLLDTDPNPAILALDAAETLLDNRELPDARPFLEQALQSAREAGLQGIERRAEALLESLGFF